MKRSGIEGGSKRKGGGGCPGEPADASRSGDLLNRRAHAGTMESADALLMGLLMSYGGSESAAP